MTGSGEPVTVVAHGLGGSIDQTRPMVGGVGGTRVLYAARGHGTSPPLDATTGYPELAADLLSVADGPPLCQHRATQALGVSLGAATLLAVLAAQPDRFARVVLFLPAVLDRPRDGAVLARAARLATAVAAGAVDGVAEAVAQELPVGVGKAGAAYVAARSRALLRRPETAPALRALPLAVPLADRSVLAAVTADVLVLGQEGDPVHPASVAREVAAALPSARLVVFGAPGALFRERARLRGLITGHLGAG